MAGLGAVALQCCCCACRCKARPSGTSGPPSPLQKEGGSRSSIGQGWQHPCLIPSLCPALNSSPLWLLDPGDRSPLWVYPSWVVGMKRMRRDCRAWLGSPHCPQHQPFLGLLHPLCPHLPLTSAGGHVHTLLILADGPRFTGCPGDEVYNGTICPPAMAPGRGDFSIGPGPNLP